jgi:hypothetical protein
MADRDKQEEITRISAMKGKKAQRLLEMVNILRSKLCRKNGSREQKEKYFKE